MTASIPNGQNDNQIESKTTTFEDKFVVVVDEVERRA
jgi:hypothetical protein